MINAVDARQLKKAGISQDEYYGQALHRAESAIIDRARRGDDSVRIALYHLSSESFDKLVAELLWRGFVCEVESWDEKQSVFTASWSGP